MKKYFPVILILAALTLSACGAKTNNDATSATQAPTTENAQKTESKSLKDLLVSGIAQKCTYEVNNDGDITKSEIIVKSNKFKSTTEISNKDGIMKVYAISDGIYYYFWNDNTKGTGTKMKIETVEANANQTDTNSEKQQGVEMDKKVDYNCSPTTLSDSDLALPANIKFMDLSETVKSLQKGNINLEDLKKLVPSQGE
jgi:hypothetical protein